MRRVSFTQMKDGTAQDYALLAEIESRELEGYADRVLAWLRSMDVPSGYQITRLQHSLQAATRAHRDGRDESYVMMCLLHDIGDVLAPLNHSQAAAAVLRPYLSDDLHWIVLHHGVFQGVYYFHHFGQDPTAREAYRDHPLYKATVEFCELYDQASFDPAYPTEPLDFFEPMVRSLFASPINDVI